MQARPNTPTNDLDGLEEYANIATQRLLFDTAQRLGNELGDNNDEPTPPTSSQANLALKQARDAKPRVYAITGLDKPNLNICLLGCQGSINQGPIDVAMHINAISESHPELKPDVIVILGDNFYPDGISSPIDPRFETQFHGIYGNPEFKAIKDVPCIVALGNHDAGRDTESDIKAYVPFNHTLLGTNPVRFEEAELQQIAHSYLSHPSDPNSELDKKSLFSQDSINYHHLPKHNMPYFYHSWVMGNVQLFVLNSNTYVKDYLVYLKHLAFGIPMSADSNQAAWVLREYQKAREKNRKVIFTMHHPMFTPGKRYYPSGWDAKHYLHPEEITQLKEIVKLNPSADNFIEKCFNVFVNVNGISTPLDTNANYNELFTQVVYDMQHMSPDLISTAHDHSIYYYNNKNNPKTQRPICQLVSGAGGSDELQARYYFGEHNHLGAFMRSHGFSLVSCDQTNPLRFDINIFFVNGMHLKFNSDSAQPIRKPSDDNNLEQLRDAVLSGCERYQSFLHSKQEFTNGKFFSAVPSIKSFGQLFSYNTTHTVKDVDCMHRIINYLNQPIPSSFNETVQYIHKVMEDIFNKESDHSLYMEINKKLLSTFGKTIQIMNNAINNPFYLI